MEINALTTQFRYLGKEPLVFTDALGDDDASVAANADSLWHNIKEIQCIKEFSPGLYGDAIWTYEKWEQAYVGVELVPDFGPVKMPAVYRNQGITQFDNNTDYKVICKPGTSVPFDLFGDEVELSGLVSSNEINHTRWNLTYNHPIQGGVLPIETHVLTDGTPLSAKFLTVSTIDKQTGVQLNWSSEFMVPLVVGDLVISQERSNTITVQHGGLKDDQTYYIVSQGTQDAFVPYKLGVSTSDYDNDGVQLPEDPDDRDASVKSMADVTSAYFDQYRTMEPVQISTIRQDIASTNGTNVGYRSSQFVNRGGSRMVVLHRTGTDTAQSSLGTSIAKTYYLTNDNQWDQYGADIDPSSLFPAGTSPGGYRSRKRPFINENGDMVVLFVKTDAGWHTQVWRLQSGQWTGSFIDDVPQNNYEWTGNEDHYQWTLMTQPPAGGDRPVFLFGNRQTTPVGPTEKTRVYYLDFKATTNFPNGQWREIGDGVGTVKSSWDYGTTIMDCSIDGEWIITSEYGSGDEESGVKVYRLEGGIADGSYVQQGETIKNTGSSTFQNWVESDNQLVQDASIGPIDDMDTLQETLSAATIRATQYAVNNFTEPPLAINDTVKFSADIADWNTISDGYPSETDDGKHTFSSDTYYTITALDPTYFYITVNELVYRFGYGSFSYKGVTVNLEFYKAGWDPETTATHSAWSSIMDGTADLYNLSSDAANQSPHHIGDGASHIDPQRSGNANGRRNRLRLRYALDYDHVITGNLIGDEFNPPVRYYTPTNMNAVAPLDQIMNFADRNMAVATNSQDQPRSQWKLVLPETFDFDINDWGVGQGDNHDVGITWRTGTSDNDYDIHNNIFFKTSGDVEIKHTTGRYTYGDPYNNYTPINAGVEIWIPLDKTSTQIVDQIKAMDFYDTIPAPENMNPDWMLNKGETVEGIYLDLASRIPLPTSSTGAITDTLREGFRCFTILTTEKDAADRDVLVFTSVKPGSRHAQEVPAWFAQKRGTITREDNGVTLDSDEPYVWGWYNLVMETSDKFVSQMTFTGPQSIYWQKRTINGRMFPATSGEGYKEVEYKGIKLIKPGFHGYPMDASYHGFRNDAIDWTPSNFNQSDNLLSISSDGTKISILVPGTLLTTLRWSETQVNGKNWAVYGQIPAPGEDDPFIVSPFVLSTINLDATDPNPIDGFKLNQGGNAALLWRQGKQYQPAALGIWALDGTFETGEWTLIKGYIDGSTNTPLANGVSIAGLGDSTATKFGDFAQMNDRGNLLAVGAATPDDSRGTLLMYTLSATAESIAAYQTP